MSIEVQALSTDRICHRIQPYSQSEIYVKYTSNVEDNRIASKRVLHVGILLCSSSAIVKAKLSVCMS